MKKKNLLALTMGTLALATLAGCSSSATVGDTKTIQIYAWESGLGKVWLEKIIEDFNASQTEFTATLETSTDAASIIKSLDVGSSNPYDLYFTMLNSFQHYDDFYALDEVLDFKNEGESKAIKDKFYPGYLTASLDPDDGKHHVLSYGNTVGGIVYNRSMVSDTDLPRTTDELSDLVVELEGDGKYAWLFYNNSDNNGYWNYLSTVWAAQYNGLDYYYNTLMKLKGEDGSTPSRATFEKKDGRYEAFKVMEQILTPSNTHPQCTSQNFTTVQMLYLQGAAALTVNGSWLLNENASTADIGMMKTPVISSIIEQLEDESIKDDETLSKVVKAIDDGETSYAGVTEKDFARVKEARNLLYNNSAEQYVFVPKYSNCIDGSVKFLEYFYKDSSVLTYMNTLHLPSNVKLDNESIYDGSNDATWNKQQFAYAENEALMNRLDSSYVFRDHSVSCIANISTAQKLINANPKARENADGLWSDMLAKIEENWEEWSNA